MAQREGHPEGPRRGSVGEVPLKADGLTVGCALQARANLDAETQLLCVLRSKGGDNALRADEEEVPRLQRDPAARQPPNVNGLPVKRLPALTFTVTQMSKLCSNHFCKGFSF